MLAKAEAALKADDTNAAIQFADQSLELAMKDSCIVAGCTESTAKNGKLFNKWTFPDYLLFLSESGRITAERKSSFFQFHAWRNPSHHDGMSIHPKQARQVVDSVTKYVKELENAYLNSSSTIPHSNAKEPVIEERDVAPIFRATPSLIQRDFRLVRGEKFLAEGLKRIDLLVEDGKRRRVFVEVKWSGYDAEQAKSYTNLIRTTEPNARILWLMPSDIRGSVPAPIERIDYDREKIAALITARRIARSVIDKILYALSAPFTPPSTLMYRMSFSFPNVMSACYFDGKVQTEKGRREIGLRKQSIGRYLDLIRSLCQSKYANETPELLLVLVFELLVAPYYLEMRGLGRVEEDGFWGDIKAKAKETSYKDIYKIVTTIHEAVSSYVSSNAAIIRVVYTDVNTHDLLYRAILRIPQNAFEMGDLVSVKRLIEYFVSEFNVTQTEPIKIIKHSVTNTNVLNSVQLGYEPDMVRRLIELAVLKRELICTSGISLIQVLKQEAFRDKLQYVRAKCQNFRINTNTDRIVGFGDL